MLPTVLAVPRVAVGVAYLNDFGFPNWLPLASALIHFGGPIPTDGWSYFDLGHHSVPVIPLMVAHYFWTLHLLLLGQLGLSPGVFLLGAGWGLPILRLLLAMTRPPWRPQHALPRFGGDLIVHTFSPLDSLTPLRNGRRQCCPKPLSWRLGRTLLPAAGGNLPAVVGSPLPLVASPLTFVGMLLWYFGNGGVKPVPAVHTLPVPPRSPGTIFRFAPRLERLLVASLFPLLPTHFPVLPF